MASYVDEAILVDLEYVDDFVGLPGVAITNLARIDIRMGASFSVESKVDRVFWEVVSDGHVGVSKDEFAGRLLEDEPVVVLGVVIDHVVTVLLKLPPDGVAKLP